MSEPTWKKRGFKNSKEYLDWLAVQAGFANDAERQKSRIERRGYKTKTEYEKERLAKKGVDYDEYYKEHMDKFIKSHPDIKEYWREYQKEKSAKARERNIKFADICKNIDNIINRCNCPDDVSDSIKNLKSLCSSLKV